MFDKTTALMQNVCETTCDICVTEHKLIRGKRSKTSKNMGLLVHRFGVHW